MRRTTTLGKHTTASSPRRASATRELCALPPRAVLIAVIAAVVSVVFALLGFILLYLDTTLPPYARGSTLWRAVVLVGNVAFLSMAVYKFVT